jgi:hypothetical protein
LKLLLKNNQELQITLQEIEIAKTISVCEKGALKSGIGAGAELKKWEDIPAKAPEMSTEIDPA